MEDITSSKDKLDTATNDEMPEEKWMQQLTRKCVMRLVNTSTDRFWNFDISKGIRRYKFDVTSRLSHNRDALNQAKKASDVVGRRQEVEKYGNKKQKIIFKSDFLCQNKPKFNAFKKRQECRAPKNDLFEDIFQLCFVVNIVTIKE